MAMPTLVDVHFVNAIRFLLRLMPNYQTFTITSTRETSTRPIQTTAPLAPVQLTCNVATILTKTQLSSYTTRTKCNAVPMDRLKKWADSVEIF